MKATHAAIVNFSDKLMKKPRKPSGAYLTKGCRYIRKDVFAKQGKEIELRVCKLVNYEWVDANNHLHYYISKWLKDIKEIK